MISACETSPIRRRSSADIEELCQHIYRIAKELKPITIRQLFYQMVTQGLIAKTEAEYKNTVCRLTAKMRKERRIPFSWFSDTSRWMRKPSSHASLEDYLSHVQRMYRRDLWTMQPIRCEIWLEKEALASVLFKSTRKWDVPLMVCKGYPSLSFLATAAEIIEASGKTNCIYYFGDYDPSGKDISRHVRETLTELAPSADVIFREVAVNPDQIKTYQLPTRPTKKSDSRSKSFDGESVELDAIHPDELRRLAEEAIEDCIDPEALAAAKRTERIEKETLSHLEDFF